MEIDSGPVYRSIEVYRHVNNYFRIGINETRTHDIGFGFETAGMRRITGPGRAGSSDAFRIY